MNEIKPPITDKRIKNKRGGSPKELLEPKVDRHGREPGEGRRM